MEKALVAGLGQDYSAFAAGYQGDGESQLLVGGYTRSSAGNPVETGTLFDIASLTKTMVATVLARLVAAQIVDVDEPVSRLLAVGSGSGAGLITLRMLATHTSGLPGDIGLWQDLACEPSQRLDRVLGVGLESEPGREFRYSCIGFIALGQVLEAATGQSLAQLLQDYVWQPLGMADTGFGPVPAQNSVATEVQDYVGRGLVHGEVHDELNWWLPQQVGNAGVFSTAPDMLAYSRIFTSPEFLGDTAFSLLTTDQRPPGATSNFQHSLGLRINDAEFMGHASGVGHTGFTGCMLFAQPAQDFSCALLTNRVHPSRNGRSPHELRREFIAATSV